MDSSVTLGCHDVMMSDVKSGNSDVLILDTSCDVEIVSTSIPLVTCLKRK